MQEAFFYTPHHRLRFFNSISCYSCSRYSTVSTLHQLFSNRATTPTIVHNAENSSKSSSPSPTNRDETSRYIARLINTRPWSSQLESSISSFFPLSQTIVLRTLHLIDNVKNALQFFNWVEKSGFNHPVHSYNLIVQRLCKTRNLNSARNFILSVPRRSSCTIQLPDKYFNTLILGYGKAGLFQESLKVYRKMKSIGVSPSVYTFNILFLILLKRGRTGMVYELYDEMLKTFGVKPDLYTFNILIRGFCKNHMVDRGYRFFMEMEKFNCEGDVVTYNTIVDGLCMAGKVKIAQNVLNGMTRKGSNLSPNVVTDTTLIRGYCGKQQIDEALGVYEEMMKRGIMPNEVTYNTLIQGLCQARKLDKVKEVLEKSEGFVPNTCTFNILMKAHCDVWNLDEAKKVFDNMSQLNVQPDSASYSVLIRCFCTKGFFDGAEELFDELLRKEILLSEDGCTPLVAAYNPVFDYLCKNGKTSKAEEVFRQLMRRGTQDALAFEILIMGHCREGAYESGYELLVLMVRRSFVPDLSIYQSLIDGLVEKAEFILAFDTLGRMMKDSHLPRTSTSHSILSGLLRNGSAREALGLIKLMLEKKIRPTISLSTDTLKVLFKHGLRERGFEIYKSLYESGYTVNMEELVTFLCQERKLLEANELLLYSIKNEQTPNLNTCGMVLSGLCKIDRVSEAFNLFYEVEELGISGKLICLEDLRIALEAKGRSREAEFVAKRMVSLFEPCNE